MGWFRSLQFKHRSLYIHSHMYKINIHTIIISLQLYFTLSLSSLYFQCHIVQTRDILASFRNKTQVSYSHRSQSSNVIFAFGTNSVHMCLLKELGLLKSTASSGPGVTHLIAPFSVSFCVSLAVQHSCPSCSQCHMQKVKYT